MTSCLQTPFFEIVRAQFLGRAVLAVAPIVLAALVNVTSPWGWRLVRGPVPCDGDVVRRVSAQLLQLGLAVGRKHTLGAAQLVLFSLGEDVLHRWLQK